MPLFIELPLTKGKVALISPEDLKLVDKYPWHARQNRRGGKWYAYTTLPPQDRKTTRSVSLHRFLMDAQPGTLVDHKDGDGLNCQRHNMRIANHTQNNAHRIGKPSWSKNTYRGVKWHTRDKRWRACLSLNNKTLHLGSFATEEDAARAYNKGALEHFGEFAVLNEVPPKHGRPRKNVEAPAVADSAIDLTKLYLRN